MKENQNMKKQYLNPCMNLVSLDACDILTSSGNETPKAQHDDTMDFGEAFKIKRIS